MSRDEKPDCWSNTVIHSRSLRALKCYFKFRPTNTHSRTHRHARTHQTPALQSANSHVAAVASFSSGLSQKKLILKNVQQTPAASPSTVCCPAVPGNFIIYFLTLFLPKSQRGVAFTDANHQEAIEKFWLSFLEISWL